MVLQRKQTLMLLAALILMIVFFLVPVGVLKTTGASLYAGDFAVPTVLGVLACALTGADIFMFRKLKRQMAMCWAIVVDLVCLAVVLAVQTTNMPGLEYSWAGTAPLLFCATILVILAWLFMRRDYNLLRSVNRFR